MLGILVGVQFDELRLAGVRGGDLFDDRTEHFARPAPRRPKIHQHGLAAPEHLVLESSFALPLLMRS